MSVALSLTVNGKAERAEIDPRTLLVEFIRNADVLIIDALRRDPHPSHSHLDKSVAIVEQLKPQRAFFTHMSHDLDHDATNANLPTHMRLAYDGQQINFEIA